MSVLPRGVQEGVPLRRHTTMRVGGPARFLSTVGDGRALVKLIQWAAAEELPWIVLGEGSNVIFADGGFDGLVIVFLRPDEEPRVLPTEGDQVAASVEVSAAMPLASLARWASRRGLGGLEWAAGIPGTVGGAVVGNAGAFGGCMADTVEQVDLGGANGIERVGLQDLGFGYRTSLLAEGARGEAVLAATMRFHRRDVSECLLGYEDALRKRRCSQPGGASSGCVFRNPPEKSAGQMLDLCGLKGRSVGDAVVSDRHANFIINRGNATAADVVELMLTCRTAVWERLGVLLQPEVRLIGQTALDRME